MSSHKRKPPRVIFVKSAQTLSGNEVENTTKELTAKTAKVHTESRALSDKNELQAAQVMDSSKAAQSGAEEIDNGKAAQSRTEEINKSKATQSGAEEIDKSKATQSGAEVMDNSKAAQSGAKVMDSGKTAHSGAEVMNSSKTAQSGAEVMDNSDAAQSRAEKISYDEATQSGAEVINFDEAAQSGAEKIYFDEAAQSGAEGINNSKIKEKQLLEIDTGDITDSQSLEVLTLLDEIHIQVEDKPGPKNRAMWQDDFNDDDSYQMSLASHMPEIGNANRRGKATTGIRMLQEISQERKMDIGIKERTKKSVMYRWFRQPKKTKVKKFKPEKTQNEKKKDNGITKFNLIGQPKKTKVKAFIQDTTTSNEKVKEKGHTKLSQIRKNIREFITRLQAAFSCRQI